MKIDGRTRLFATIGSPVMQVRLPEVMQPVFELLGLNAVWVPLEVDPGHFRQALAALRLMRNLGGMTIAIPFKVAILDLADRVSDRARRAGAANLFRVDADGGAAVDTVDGLGFVLGLRAHGHEPAGKSAWIVGTGGGGSSVGAALCEAGIRQLFLTDIKPDRSVRLAARLGTHFPDVEITVWAGGVPHVHYAVNASPSGLRIDDPLPFDPARLPPDSVVCDIIMKPADTRLLRTAAAAGYRVHYGRHMLDHQISPYLHFFGIEHDESQVLKLVSNQSANL